MQRTRIGLLALSVFVALFVTGCPDPAAGGKKTLMIYPKYSVTVDTPLIINGSEVGVGPVVSTRNIPFILKNEGDTDLAISSLGISGDGEFSMGMAADKSVLAGGETTEFSLSFTAGSTIGEKSTYIEIVNDSDNQAYVKFKVKGTVVPGSSPTHVVSDTPKLTLWYENPITVANQFIHNADMGIPLGSVSAATDENLVMFKLENSGYKDLVITSLGLEAGGSPEISIRLDTLYHTIMPSFADSFIVALRKGTSTGVKTAVIRLATNDPSTPIFSFQVTGAVE